MVKRVKESDHSRFVGGSFNKQGNLHIRLVLAGCEEISTRIHQNLKCLYRGLT